MPPSKTPRLLIIAGSDSGGGAGIQADIKTATVLGAYATTAITAITAQDTEAVHAIHAVPEETILAQIRAVLDDIGADAIKTGMLASSSVIKIVRQGIKDAGVPLILDPVMVAKGGAKLLEDDAQHALKSELLPLAFLATPNLPEAEMLVGFPVQTIKDQKRAGEALCEAGAHAALIKGGHGEDSQSALIHDVLVCGEDVEVFESPRIPTQNTHGTGCTLASAIASFIARGDNLKDAVRDAREYVFGAIKHAPHLGKGHGPLNHFYKNPSL